MAQLPENRTLSSTPTQHLSDHLELHRLHNIIDALTGGPADADDVTAVSDALQAHLDDAVDSHDASSISTSGATPSDVQTVLDDHEDRIDDLEVTPPNHASRHGAAGADPISIAGEQVTSGTIDKQWIDSEIARSADVVANTEKGVAGGVATLDGSGVIPTAQLPPLAINEVYVAADQTAMLALTAQRGDVARRTDSTPNKIFLLSTDDPTQVANWVEITATGSVTSVNGASGAVDLSATYQPLDSDLTAIAALTTTNFGRSVLTQADASALRTLAGLGSAAVAALIDDDTFASATASNVPSAESVKAYIDGTFVEVTSGDGIVIDNPAAVRVDSTVARLTATQTLTNKTLTSPSLTTLVSIISDGGVGHHVGIGGPNDGSRNALLEVHGGNGVAFGWYAPALTFMHHSGTNPTYSQTAAGNTIGNIAARGYMDTGGYASSASARILMAATDAFTSAARGATMSLSVTPTGTTTLTTALFLSADAVPAVQILDGAVGTPALGFIADTDAGLYRPGSNQVAFTTGGTQRWLLDSNGMVSRGGIATGAGSGMAAPRTGFDLDMAGSAGFSMSRSTHTLTDANQDNLDLGNAMFVEISCTNLTAARNITGIVAPASGTSPIRILNFHTMTAPRDINLTHDDGVTSTAANRFSINNQLSATITASAGGGQAIICYSQSESRWKILSVRA